MKKTIFFLAIILLSLNSLSSQQKKHITPTSISFVEKSVISSKRKFEKSIDKFVVKMFKSVINAVEKEDNINIDTKNMINLGKKTVVPLMKSEYKDLVKEYCYKIYNDKVVQFEKQNDKVVGDYKVVNKSTGKYRYLAKKDSITYYGKEQLYTYLNDDVIVKEYRNKTKKIGKINCFKVVYKKRISAKEFDNSFSEFVSKFYEIYELYVTEDFRLDYHPIIKNEFILKKYYPLEVKITKSYIKGAYKEIKMNTINFYKD